MRICLLESKGTSYQAMPASHFFKYLLSFLIALSLSTAMYAQQAIRGRIISSDSALAGATVVVKETGVTTQTDVNGNFIIQAPSNATLQITSVGFSTYEEKINNRSNINIQMESKAQELSDVVVVGYGTQRRKDVTGAVSTVKATDLDKVNAVSIDNLLQGKAPGLNINTYTAQPGGGISVNIRGALSPKGSNSPLYVIDGVPITNNNATDNFGNGQTGFWGGTDRNPLNTINPNDIESIDILKDASASAIYGAAAANGVILITTKRGKEGKSVVSYNGSYSIQTTKDYLKPLNAHDFMVNHNLYAEEYWKLSNKIAPYGTANPTSVPPFTAKFSQADISNAGAGTNWVNYLLRDGLVNDQNVSVSGGTAFTKAYASFNYLDQTGILRGTGLKRFSGRINLDQKLGSRVVLKLGLSYTQIANKNQNTGQQGDPDSPSPLQSALRYAPTFGPYDSTGELTHSYLVRTPNPQSWLMINNTTNTKRLFFNPSVEVNVIKGLKATVTQGVDQNNSVHNLYVPVSAKFQTALSGVAQLATNYINNYSTEGYLTYNTSFGNSTISAVAGAGYYKTNSSNFGLEGVGFFTDAFGTSNVAIAENRNQNAIFSGKSERTKLSQFVRVNYSFLDKYTLTFNGRRDGSSGFAPNKKWGFFPGVSAGWVISDEPFMQGISKLDMLKIRAGYGSTGNESIVVNGNYAYSLYGTYYGWQFPFGTPSQISTGILQTQTGNPNLSWETDITSNIGIDFSLLNNRLTGSVDYYRRRANDLLDFLRLPSANPIGQLAANIGSTQSKGIEIGIKGLIIDKQALSWTTNIVFSTNKSYWVERNPENMSLNPWVGLHDPIHAVYGWKTNGLITPDKDIPTYQPDALPGNLRYVDVNNDGKLDISDVQYLGNTDPKAFYGFGNTLTWKSFDLNVFIYGSLGGLQSDNWLKIGQVGGSVGLSNSAPSNAEEHSLKSWSTFNPTGTYPGIAPDLAAGNNPTHVNDFGMRKVSFGRLKNITLGYNLPSSLLAKTNTIHSLRVFVDMQNIAVFGNYSGLDPEMEQFNFPYPVARTTAFGVNVQF
ncbi:MAG TPA: SusC/RagA family TonB-linked outer membrane protein [Flavitalea sp.]|nr:SusC/RagA family TonB-linked outer membrane protein [Flavitalea sp.]